MARYDVKVVVEYYYEVEADSRDEAEEMGYDYEEYQHSGQVESITVEEIEEDEDDVE